MPDLKRGTLGDDTLQTSDTIRRIYGQRGDDYLSTQGYGGGAWGGAGDDTLVGGGPGAGQSHLYGGAGADTIYLNITDLTAPYGDHVWGEQGADKFIFMGGDSDSTRVTGRIDDFDPTRDEIWVDDTRIDLANLPEGVRLVGLYDQPWILIDDRALFALEGARKTSGVLELPPGTDPDGNANGEERHFIRWPEEWANGVPPGADIPYEDYVSYFPRHESPPRDWDMNSPRYTAGDDVITGDEEMNRLDGGDGNDRLSGQGGGDVLHAGEGFDTLYGGAGRDSLSGGLDNDTLFGGHGADILYGGSGQDVLHGDADNDRLHGNNGNDRLFGGAGHDTLYGGIGDDTLEGGGGNDLLFASYLDEEAARLNVGIDHLSGGEGDDTLVAAEGGEAIMTGGDGSDVFLAELRADVILTDFRPGEDFLDLNGLSPGAEALDARLIGRDRMDSLSPQDLMLLLPGDATVLFQGLAGADRAELLASIGQSKPIDPPPDRPDGPDDPDDPDDPDKPKPGEEDEEEGGGDCFVAGACFGHVAHPDVDWLRRYREQVLRHSAAGRGFISFYWWIGPKLARHIRRHPRLKALCRTGLQRLVARGRARVTLKPWPERDCPARPDEASGRPGS